MVFIIACYDSILEMSENISSNPKTFDIAPLSKIYENADKLVKRSTSVKNDIHVILGQFGTRWGCRKILGVTDDGRKDGRGHLCTRGENDSIHNRYVCQTGLYGSPFYADTLEPEWVKVDQLFSHGNHTAHAYGKILLSDEARKAFRENADADITLCAENPDFDHEYLPKIDMGLGNILDTEVIGSTHQGDVMLALWSGEIKVMLNLYDDQINPTEGVATLERLIPAYIENLPAEIMANLVNNGHLTRFITTLVARMDAANAKYERAQAISTKLVEALVE